MDGQWCSWITTWRWADARDERWVQSFKVQRTAERAEVTAFLCTLRKAVGPAMVHVDKEGMFDGLWRGEMRCTGPRAQDADVWILIWEELHGVQQEGIPVEVEHVKAHRSKKVMQQMSLFEKVHH